MLKIYAGLLLGLACFWSPTLTSAASYVVTVTNAQAGLIGDVTKRCIPKAGGSCDVSLGELSGLVSTPGWKQRLRDLGVDKVVVSFVDESYRLNTPLKLKWSSDVAGVVLELSGRNARILGSVPLQFKRAQGGGGAFPASVLSHLWVSSVPIQFDKRPPIGFGLPESPTSGELVYRKTLQPVARWPNSGFASIVRPGGLQKGQFRITGRNSSDWKGEQELYAFAFWFNDWSSQTYPVKYSSESDSLEVIGGDVKYGVKAGQRVRIVNSIRELDVEGEWYLERSSGSLYWWAPVGFDGSGGEYVSALSLLDIQDSSDVKVAGLSFESSRGDAVLISNARNVVLDGVVIRNAGGRSLVVAGGEACGIRNSTIVDSGAGGVVLSGGDRSSLKSGKHFVASSEISNFSRFGSTYKPAVMISGVGMSVVGNSIHDAGHAAIIFSGNDHLISGNEIYRVVTESSDAGAVYVGRDFTARGSKVAGNYFHDIGQGYSTDVKGIYLDDQASGIEVSGNVFVRVRQPVFIGGGRDNTVSRNIFIESSPAVYLDARGALSQKSQTVDPAGALMKGLSAVPYKGALWASRYPNLPTILDDEFGRPKYNVFCANLVINGGGAKVGGEAASGIKVSGNLEAGEGALAVGDVSAAVEKRNFAIRKEYLDKLLCQ